MFGFYESMFAKLTIIVQQTTSTTHKHNMDSSQIPKNKSVQVLGKVWLQSKNTNRHAKPKVLSAAPQPAIDYSVPQHIMCYKIENKSSLETFKPKKIAILRLSMF